MLTLFPRIKPNPLPPAPPAATLPVNEEPLAVAPSVDMHEVVAKSTAGAVGMETSSIEPLIAAAGDSEPQIEPIAAQAPEAIAFPHDGSQPVLTVLAEIPFVTEFPAAGPSASALVEAVATDGPLPVAPEAVRESLLDAFSSAFEAAANANSANAEGTALALSPADEVAVEQPASEAPDSAGPAITPSESSISTMNLFDEIDVLQEAAQPAIDSSALKSAATAPELSAETSPTPTIEADQARAEPPPHSEVAAVVTTAPDAAAGGLGSAQPALAAFEPGPSRAEFLPEVIPSPIAGEASPVPARLPTDSAESVSAEAPDPTPARVESEPTASRIVPKAVTSASAELPMPSEGATSPPETAELPIEAAARAALAASRAEPVRADRAAAKRTGFFVLPRVPEPEVMDDSGEVEAYASAAAQSHLDAIDDTFVAHAQLLLKGRERGRALDIGTGPGQIVIKLGYQLTRWKFVGVDRSAAMIGKAREALETAPELAGRVDFFVADGNHLDFPSHSFDLVYCNSVLHHLADPQKLFAEMARLVKPRGAILLRDLVRPSRFGFGHHIRKHGKHYSGEMKRLFIASVRAAYTAEELQQLLGASPLRAATVFRHGKTHIGFARPVGNPGSRQTQISA